MTRLEEGPIVAQRLALTFGQLRTARLGERYHIVQLRVVKYALFARPLKFDKRTGAGENHVHIDLRARILRVTKIERRRVLYKPDANSRHAVAQRIIVRFRKTVSDEIQRVNERDASAGDAKRTRTAVRLQDIAVQVDGSRSERFREQDGAQSSTDESLNFRRASVRAIHSRFSHRRAGRQHAIFGGDPTSFEGLVSLFHPFRQVVDNGSGTERDGIARANENAAGRGGKLASDRNGTKLVVKSSVDSLNYHDFNPFYSNGETRRRSNVFILFAVRRLSAVRNYLKLVTKATISGLRMGNQRDLEAPRATPIGIFRAHFYNRSRARR